MSFNPKKVKTFKRILILGDIHLPFPDWEALKQAQKFAKEFKPDLVVQMGDLIDAKAWSKYQKDPDDLSPQTEFDLVAKQIKILHKMFPKMVILQGNHEARFSAKKMEAQLPTQLVRSLREVFDMKGWWWVAPGGQERAVVKSGGKEILFVHGDEMAGNVVAKAKRLGLCVVQGHTHKAELGYVNDFHREIFGLDVGCMADLSSKAMRYAASNPTSAFVGFGYIEDGVPGLKPIKKKIA